MKLRTTAIAAGLAASSLFLAGCTGGGGDEPAATSDLVLIQATPPISLDPALSNTGIAETFIDLAYGSLIHVTSDGQYEPSFAETWEYVGEGNLQFEITLRDDLTFADGTPFDAEAVKGYLEYYIAAQGPFAQTADAVIDRVEAPDDLTVEVYLASPYPDMELQFSEAGLWGAIVSPAGIADPDSLGTSTAGAGAYQLDAEQTVSGSSYVYEPNDEYFNPEQQKWDTVTVNVIADPNAALQAVTSGQAQWVAGTADQREAAAAAGLTEQVAVLNALIFMIQDRDGVLVPALADVRVRQALNYAVDRDAIADLIGGEPNSQIVSADRTGYNTEAESVYEYDVDMAKSLLAEAGYADGFDLPVIVGDFDPVGSRAIEVISEQFAAIGVNVQITSAPTFPDFAREQESGNFPATILPWGSTTMFTVAQQLVLPTGVVNPFRSSNDEFNTLFEQAASVDPSEGEAVWQELSLSVTEEGWFVPVAYYGVPFFSTDGINPAGDGFTFPNPLYF